MFAVTEKVGVIINGKMVQVGTPNEVYDNPMSLAVARLIGDVNEITGELKGNTLYYGSFRVELPFTPNTNSRIGIRPENIFVTETELSDGDWTLAGKGLVTVSSYMGGVYRVLVRDPQYDQATLTIISQRPYPSEQEVYVYFKKKGIMVLESSNI
jgi:ABC-type Fe3+/spermidine/putrescine transport system ATPase subunit